MLEIIQENVLLADKNKKYEVCVLDGNGNPCPNQTVTFRYVNEKVDVKTDENGIAGFEGIRINQYNTIEIEYNGYSISNKDVQFKMYPYTVADRAENGYIPRIYPISILK